MPKYTFEEVTNAVPGSSPGKRPRTAAVLPKDNPSEAESSLDLLLKEIDIEPSGPASTSLPECETSPPIPDHVPRGRKLRLFLLTTWGDPRFMGLTSIQVITCKSGH